MPIGNKEKTPEHTHSRSLRRRMDSGLGSDEERRVLRLSSSANIDASSLSDDAEVVPLVLPVSNTAGVSDVNPQGSSEHLNSNCHEAAEESQQSKVVHQWSGRVLSTTGNSSSSSNGEEERRQGALLFRTSIPQYSMLQMELNMHHHRLMSENYSCSSQQDLRTEYEQDKEDGREKDESTLAGSCDKIHNISNTSRQQGAQNSRAAPPPQVFSLDYCNDNDMAANCSHSSTGLPRGEKRLLHNHNGNSESSTACATPFNSMVQLVGGSINNVCEVNEDSEEAKRKSEEEAEAHKTSLGFYVDLNDVDEPQPPTTAQETARKKNIFSMVIDFEAPKKEKPRLPSSLLRTGNGNGSKSADVNGKGKKNGESSTNGKREVSSAGHVRAAVEQANAKASTNSAPAPMSEKELQNWRCSDDSEPEHDRESPRQFVRLSDLDSGKKVESNADSKSSATKNNSADSHCEQHVMLDLNRAGVSGVMSRSIPPPPHSFVESPMFLMSRSIAAYRSSPPPFSSQSHHRPGASGNRTPLSSSRPSSGGTRSVARLGTDLLRMFLEEIETDVQVSVNGRRMRAHRCILVSRCQYFAASLSGRTSGSGGPSSDVVIPLDGFSYDSVHFAMCHIYSGASHVPDSVSLVELASLADLLCLEGLKEVVSNELQQKHCHSFHPPCSVSPKSSRQSKRIDLEGGCVEGVLEVLPLAAAYGLDELYQKCLQWIAKYFTQVWPTRSFGQLPRELRDKCHRYMEVHLLPETVLKVAEGTLKIRHALDDKQTNSRWVDVVLQLAGQLYDDCQMYLRGHLSTTLEDLHHRLVPEKRGQKHSVGSAFDEPKHPHSSLNRSEVPIIKQLEDMLIVACRSLSSLEQICRSYARCGRIINDLQTPPEEQEDTWPSSIRSIVETMQKIEATLEEKILAMGDKILRCAAWECIEEASRNKIRQLYIQQKQQEKDEDSSLRSTPGSRGSGNSPPATRLPRATRTTQARESHARRRQQQQQGGTHPILQSSSESSSRNSSPLTGNRRMQLSSTREQSRSTGTVPIANGKTTSNNMTTGSPSLRRSLLMAARVPQQQQQVPPSPLQARRTVRSTTVSTVITSNSMTNSASSATRSRSTLTQATASSAAKSAPPRHVRPTATKDAYTSTSHTQQKSQSAPTSIRQDTITLKQQNKMISSGMSRSMTHSTSSKHEPVNNRNTPRPVANVGVGGVRRSPDIRQNRATTPTMARKRAGSSTSSVPSTIVSPSAIHRGPATDAKSTTTQHVIPPSEQASGKASSSRSGSGVAKSAQVASEKKTNKNAQDSMTAESKPPPHLEDTPTIQRSGTFLKEKPTVLTIEHQKQSIASDATVH